MRIFIIVTAIFLMLGLLVVMAVAVARVQRRTNNSQDSPPDWNVIEPAQLEDGTPVAAELSQQQKAHRVLAGRVYRDTQEQTRAGARIGLLVLLTIVLLAALVLVPALVVMLEQ
ncbi:MAG: hypothetical protein ACE5FI_14450 [Anaerolineales bacterium]